MSPAQVLVASGDAVAVAALVERVTRDVDVPVLVVTSNMREPLPPPIFAIAARARRISPRCRDTHFELGPVLAWRADAKALALARTLAQGSILVVSPAL